MPRRDRRQTGSTRTARPTKMESVWATQKRGQKGPLPWDSLMPDIRKPTNRELRRSFGTVFQEQTRPVAR